MIESTTFSSNSSIGTANFKTGHDPVDHDPVGRHGVVLSAEAPIPPTSRAHDIRETVDSLYADFDAWEARILATIQTRTSKMALADTVNAPSVDTHHSHAA